MISQSQNSIISLRLPNLNLQSIEDKAPLATNLSITPWLSPRCCRKRLASNYPSPTSMRRSAKRTRHFHTSHAKKRIRMARVSERQYAYAHAYLYIISQQRRSFFLYTERDDDHVHRRRKFLLALHVCRSLDTYNSSRLPAEPAALMDATASSSIFASPSSFDQRGPITRVA